MSEIVKMLGLGPNWFKCVDFKVKISQNYRVLGNTMIALMISNQLMFDFSVNIFKKKGLKGILIDLIIRQHNDCPNDKQSANV